MKSRFSMSAILFIQFYVVFFGLTMLTAIASTNTMDSRGRVIMGGVVISALVLAGLAKTLAPRLRAHYWRRQGRIPKALFK